MRVKVLSLPMRCQDRKQLRLESSQVEELPKVHLEAIFLRATFFSESENKSSWKRMLGMYLSMSRLPKRLMILLLQQMRDSSRRKKVCLSIQTFQIFSPKIRR